MNDEVITLKNCPCCERLSDTVEKRRLCTQYQNEESNYLLSCEECFEEYNREYQEYLSEYYRNLL